MKFINTIILSLVCCHLVGQAIDFEDPSYHYAKSHLNVLQELLAIPNDAHYPEQIEENLQWCENVFSHFGMTSQRLETETVPLLLAELPRDENLKTIMFYFHIDGQPVDPQFWFQDDPYQAVLKKSVEGEGWVDIPWRSLTEETIDPDWRIFARSSSDDKSPFVMFIAALRQLQDAKKSIPYNLKVILDFEEEIGSPRLAPTVKKNKVALASDVLLIFDGPKHITNQPSINFGARGITTISLKVFGPTYPLHSGHYGNYAPNPALRLSQLLSSMKDEEGRVTIEGFYDGIVLDDETKAILSAVPDEEKELMVRLGIGETDKVGSNYQEAIQFPSLNIRGLSSGWTGDEARTIVPATATADIDIRLVVESDPDRLLGLVKKHIQDQGYHLIDKKPTSRERIEYPKIVQYSNRGAYKAFRTDFDSPAGLWVYHTLKKTFDQEPIRVRTTGGSLPTTPFITTLSIPAVIVPLVNSDNNQHSPNENLRVGNFFDGVKTIYGLLNSKY